VCSSEKSLGSDSRASGVGGVGGRVGKPSSAAVITSAFQSILGSTFFRSCGFGTILSDTNSQSLGCRGKEVEVDLQALTAQVRKLRVRTFIFAGFDGGTCGCGGWARRKYGSS